MERRKRTHEGRAGRKIKQKHRHQRGFSESPFFAAVYLGTRLEDSSLDALTKEKSLGIVHTFWLELS